MTDSTDKDSQPRLVAGMTEGEIQLLKDAFIERLRFAFDNASNAEIARRINTTDKSIKNYMDGDRFPSFPMLFQVSRVTGINIHWLITGRGPRREESAAEMFSAEEEFLIRDAARSAGKPYEEYVRTVCLLALAFKNQI